MDMKEIKSSSVADIFMVLLIVLAIVVTGWFGFKFVIALEYGKSGEPWMVFRTWFASMVIVACFGIVTSIIGSWLRKQKR